MRFSKTVLLLIFIVLFNQCTEQNNFPQKQINEFYIASWNIENLFDTVDDADKADEWFTAESEIKWTHDRLQTKTKNLAKVISYMNKGNGPDLLGIQEVEHADLLFKILDNLKTSKRYKVIHEESPDARGIDNALIYNSDLFKLIKHEALTVELEKGKTTRQIIYAELKISDESIHVFVNHWPSRREGLKETEWKRIKAAKTLMKKLKQIGNFEDENIIIIGDFNDLPSNISIKKILGAENINCDSNYSDFTLLNLAYSHFQEGKGTYKYRDHWNMLDQIIISNRLFDQKAIDYNCGTFEIIKPEYIIQKDGKYAGTSLPTYGGRKYLGGYSDHFSIGAEFIISTE